MRLGIVKTAANAVSAVDAAVNTVAEGIHLCHDSVAWLRSEVKTAIGQRQESLKMRDSSRAELAQSELALERAEEQLEAAQLRQQTSEILAKIAKISEPPVSNVTDVANR